MQSYLALDVHDMHMDLRNVVQNNLGGKGPNTSAAAAEELRYENIFPNLTTGSVDLVVTALTKYQPKNTGNNGVNGEVGSINFRGGRSTTFLFKFVDNFNHSKNVTLEKLFFSYYDIDNDRKELREEISTPTLRRPTWPMTPLLKSSLGVALLLPSSGPQLLTTPVSTIQMTRRT